MDCFFSPCLMKLLGKKNCQISELLEILARTCATNTSKESYNVKQKTVQIFDSYFKLNEKKVSKPTTNPFIEILATQPNTSNNEILKPLEGESSDFDKTPSNAITDIQTPTLRKSLSSENLETP